MTIFLLGCRGALKVVNKGRINVLYKASDFQAFTRVYIRQWTFFEFKITMMVITLIMVKNKHIFVSLCVFLNCVQYRLYNAKKFHLSQHLI